MHKLTLFGVAAVSAACLAGMTPEANASSLFANVAGNVTFTQPTPSPTQQVTIKGSFGSYAASPDLPQIAGGDLNQYSFTLTASNPTYIAATNTAIYGTTTGTINGYGADVQDIAVTNLTFNINAGLVTGTLESLDPNGIHPTGFPAGDIINFTPADGALLSVRYTPTGVEAGTFAGTLSVPEPASLALLGSALLGVGMVRRRR